jgi:hypothetical protein
MIGIKDAEKVECRKSLKKRQTELNFFAENGRYCWLGVANWINWSGKYQKSVQFLKVTFAHCSTCYFFLPSTQPHHSSKELFFPIFPCLGQESSKGDLRAGVFQD